MTSTLLPAGDWIEAELKLEVRRLAPFTSRSDVRRKCEFVVAGDRFPLRFEGVWVPLVQT